MTLSQLTAEMENMASFVNTYKPALEPGTPEESMKAEEAILDLSIDLRDLKKAVRKAGKA